MSATTHPIPLQVQDVTTGQYRDASAVELEQFKTSNKMSYTKWANANRTEVHKHHVNSGLEDKHAWSLAFQEYPKPINSKPRFLFTPTTN